MNEYRVTKYNPAFRNQYGHYMKDEWTILKQVGQTFSGVVLTSEEYKRVEDAYVQVALNFLGESGLTSLKVAGLENLQNRTLDFSNDQVLALDRIGEIIRSVLREEYWCRLEVNEGFLHFGWDYYMYIGVAHSCPKAEALAVELGLFVEEYASPVRFNLEESIAEGDAGPR